MGSLFNHLIVLAGEVSPES